MKKLFVIFLVLAFVAPAMAADNLSVNGQVRMRTWDRENYSDFNDDGGDKDEYVEQRFRLQATIKANDQVKAVTRVDLAENAWGSSNWNVHRYNDSPGTDIKEQGQDPADDEDVTKVGKASSNSVIQVDRAYLDITTGPVNIIAGQQFMAVGQSHVIRNNKPGVQVTIKTPVVVELGYSVEQDEDQGAAADEQNLHLSVGFKSDAFSVEGFYGTQMTSTEETADEDIEDTKTVFGVNGKTSFGPVKLNAELALFGGDNGAKTDATDYMGTQFNVDADMKISDMIKIGADLIYSDGNDSAKHGTDRPLKEQKISFIGDVFGRLNRSEGGSGNNIIAGDLAPLGGDDVFDPLDRNQGAMGLGVDAVITPVAGLDILVHVLYLSAVEDTVDESGYDTALVYNLGVAYALAPKAKLALYYNAVAPSMEGTQEEDTASGIYGLLQIGF